MMYEMMYTIPKADCIIRIEMGVMGLGFALVCTLGATIYTCIKELKEKQLETSSIVTIVQKVLQIVLVVIILKEFVHLI